MANPAWPFPHGNTTQAADEPEEVKNLETHSDFWNDFVDIVHNTAANKAEKK